MQKLRPSIVPAAVIGLASLACGPFGNSPPPASPAPHADGVEYYARAEPGPAPVLTRLLDGTSSEGQPRARVTWRGGRVVSWQVLRPGGAWVDSSVDVATGDDGRTAYTERSAYGALTAVETFTAAGQHRRVDRSGVDDIRGCVALEVRYTDGRVAREACQDAGGNVIVDQDGCQVRAYSWSAAGDPLEVHCRDEFDHPAADGEGVSTTRFKVDASGQETQRTFYDTLGNAVGQASDGCFGWRTAYDASGRPGTKTCLNAGGLPIAVFGSQHAGEILTYDANSCLTSRAYVGVAGEPSHAGHVASERFTNDANCGVLDEQHLDSAGELIQPVPWQPAEIVYLRNDDGLAVRQECWGDRGRVASCEFLEGGSRAGSVLQLSYDDHGRLVESRAFTTQGVPTRHNSDYPHIWRHLYGSDGREARQTFADASGATAKGLGVMQFSMLYDPLGALISQRFEDAEGSLVRSPTVRCAEVRSTYDARHRLAAKDCLKPDGRPEQADMISDGVRWDLASHVSVVRGESGEVVANLFTGNGTRRVDCTSLRTPCFR